MREVVIVTIDDGQFLVEAEDLKGALAEWAWASDRGDVEEAYTARWPVAGEVEELAETDNDMRGIL